jgi:WD40 repeat protein
MKRGFPFRAGSAAALCLVSALFWNSCNNQVRETGPDITVYPQLGHSEKITAAVFSPGGKYIVSGSWDAAVKLWDAGSKREVLTFSGHTGEIESIAVSPEGLVASASRDGTVRVWSIETGTEIYRFQERVFSVTFADENTLLTASAEGLKLRDLTKDEDPRVITAESSASAHISEDGRFIVSGSQGIKFRDMETGRESRISDIPAVMTALSRDGKIAAAGTWDGTVYLWETESGKNTLRLKAHLSRINSIAFSHDNDSRYIVTASEDGRATIWDTRDVYNYKNLLGHSGSINSVSFSPDDRIVVSASSDKTIKTWDAESGELIATMGGQSDPPRASVISGDNKYIVSFSHNNRLRIWNAETGQLIDLFEFEEPVSSIFFAEDGSILAVLPGGDVKTFSLKTGKELRRFSGPSGEPALLRAFSADGKRVISILWNNVIHIWDYQTGERKILSLEDDTMISAAALSPDARHFAAGFIDGRIIIGDPAGGTERLLAEYGSRIESVQFSMDGKSLAAGFYDGTIRLLDTASGREIVPAMKHQFRVHSAAPSGDGSRIISSAHDNTTRLWNAKTGEEIVSFIGFIDGEWISITHDGYYNSSLLGDEHINVRAGGGLYSMDQFKAVFYQAAVVEARLRDDPDPGIVSRMGELRMAMVPPAVEVKVSGETSSGKTEILVSVRDYFRPVSFIQIIVNGRLLGPKELGAFSGSRELRVENTRLAPEEAAHEMKFSLPINPEAGSNCVQVIASNDYGAEGRGKVYVNNVAGGNLPAPDIWVLAVGSNNYLYGSPENNLRYSVNNARGIKAVFEAQAGKRYRNVWVKVISDEDTPPTKANILAGIDEYFSAAAPEDVLLLYLSGHGEDSGEAGKYYFLPRDVPFPGGEPDYSKAISLDDISAFSDLPGRKFVFIDSCFSGGGIDNGRLTRNLKNQSTVIFTSSQDNRLSREGSGMLQYGIFTESLILGIGRDAAVNKEVRILTLEDYVVKRVTMLSGEMQRPYTYIPEGFYSFVLAETE